MVASELKVDTLHTQEYVRHSMMSATFNPVCACICCCMPTMERTDVYVT